MDDWKYTQIHIMIGILNKGISELKKEIPNYKHDIDEKFIKDLGCKTNKEGFIEAHCWTLKEIQEMENKDGK